MADDPTWDFQNPAGKDRLLGGLRREIDEMFDLAADPDAIAGDADITDSGLKFSPGDINTCAAILEFDPASLLLTAHNRINGGTVHGDPQLAANFRSLFVSI